MWRHLVIALNLFFCQLAHANICEASIPVSIQYGNIGSPPVLSKRETYQGAIRISRIIVWWFDAGSQTGTHGAFTAISIKVEAEDGVTVLGDAGWWSADLVNDVKSQQEILDVPAGRNVVAMDQLYTEPNGSPLATGFRIELDDGS